MKANLPAIQFYVGDWRKDPGIQALDYEARGVWLEILCLMHESEDRGKLLLNGNPMADGALARILGIPEAHCKQIVSKIEAYGVASRDGESGALINRRMVREQKLTDIRSEAGRKGGEKSRPPVSETKTRTDGSPSSSSSYSPSKIDVTLPKVWEPNDTHRRIAKEEDVDIGRESLLFRDHAAATGRKLKDWHAGFRTWLRKANGFSGRKPTPPQPPMNRLGEW